MLRNRPAADELADIQSEISALQAREQVLCDMLLSDPDSRMGFTHEVVIERQRCEVFCRDRLPGYVARDPAFWEKQVTHKVTLRERHGPPTSKDMSRARGIRPGDPISLKNAADSFSLVSEERDGFDVLETFGR